jgi:hypothetical protein
MWAGSSPIGAQAYRLQPSLEFSLFWWRGEDSNLRSHFRQQVYSLPVLTTHPPRHYLTSSLEPKGGFEPPTYRLQIGCATIAPLGRCHERQNERVSRPRNTKVRPKEATPQVVYAPRLSKVKVVGMCCLLLLANVSGCGSWWRPVEKGGLGYEEEPGGLSSLG